MRLQAQSLHPKQKRLEDAGLIERARVHHGRERPLDAWTINAEARPGGDGPRVSQNLGRWLARALRAPGRGLPAFEGTGRQIGRELAAPEAGDDEASRKIEIKRPSLP